MNDQSPRDSTPPTEASPDISSPGSPPESAARPSPSKARRSGFVLRWLVLRFAFVAGGLCLVFAAFQRSLIYHPEKATSLLAGEADYRLGELHDVAVTSPVGELHGWHGLPAGQAAESTEEAAALLRDSDAPVVLYFPGNAGHRGFRLDEFELFSSLGAHIVLIDYRGYAENPGSPSEAGLVDDAHAAWNWLTRDRGVAPSRVILHGESLGGGVATRLASDLCQAGTPPGGLVVRATFDSLTHAAQRHFPWLPVRILLIDTFRSDRAIAHVTCPILQFHGARDTIVPIDLGRKLFKQAPAASVDGIAKRFVELKNADHSDMLAAGGSKMSAALREWLDTLKQRTTDKSQRAQPATNDRPSTA